MVLYLFVIAIANVGVGFAAAAFLGWRYRAVLRAGALVRLSAPVPDPRDSTPKPAIDPGPVMVARPAPLPDMPKSEQQLAVEDFHKQVDSYAAQLIETDRQLRQCATSPDLGTIESLLGTIESTSRGYVENRDSAHRRMADLSGSDAACEKIQNDLNVAAQLQDAEIKAACQDIANFDYESDLGEGCRKILGRANRLLSANDLLRDTLDRALADVAQQDGRAPTESERSDAMTGCVNRSAIEDDLNASWEIDPAQRRLCVGMVDIDRLANVNQQFGYELGNEVLCAVARLLESTGGSTTTVSRYSGQRFLLLFNDSELGDATRTVEHCRQTIERAHFNHEDFDIQITVSCGVTVVTADDSQPAMFERLEGALCEAKRYGHNRTFAHEGKFPTPVVPPEMEIEEKWVTF